MKQRLPLKPSRRNPHPLTDHRIAAARNGWVQNPCTLKTDTCKGWNKLACSVADIETLREWRGQRWLGTAIRIVGEIAGYDSDLTIQEISDKIHDDLFSLDPEAYNSAIMRDSGGVSLAMFFRCRTPFRQYKTHSYTAHPELLPEYLAAFDLPETTEHEHNVKMRRIRDLKAALEPQKVEIYGPLSKARYFQYEGPHSEGREYHCNEDRGPWNTRVDELPYLPLEPGELIDRADKILGEHLTQIPEPPDGGGTTVYDLTEDTVYYPKDGSRSTVGELAIGLDAGAENGVRGCLASSKPGSRSEANCNLFVTYRGHIVVTEWSADGRHHYMVDDKPPDPEELGEALREAMQGLHATAPPPEDDRPSRSPTRDSIDRSGTPEETHDRARDWLLEHVAFYPQAFRGHGGAVSIRPDGEFVTPITTTALRGAMSSFGWVETGPRGGQHVRNPVGAWTAHPAQVVVHGVRMRPELPRPTFREDGLLMLNRYAPPRHPSSGGTIDEFETFMARLVADPVECAWAWNWLRLLVQQPEWRMIGLAMVAREMGSGRGLLAETLGRVLGEKFVAPLPYAKLSGGAGARFNSEVADKLLIYVNESRDADDRKFAHKNAAREALKDFVEPNHELPFRVEPKNQDAYFTRAAISTLVFSNNIDGLPIGDGDRRMAVVLNGPQMTVDEVVRFREWLGRPENIGALYRALRDQAVESDRTVFDPYMAPEFHGRDLMIEASKTALDRAWDAAVAKVGTASDLYTMAQIIKLTRHFAGGARSNDFDDLVEKHTIVNGYRIGTRHSTNWLVTFEGERHRVYALDEAGRRRYGGVQKSDILKQLVCSKRVVDSPDKLANKLLHLVEKGTDSE